MVDWRRILEYYDSKHEPFVLLFDTAKTGYTASVSHQSKMAGHVIPWSDNE